MRGHRRQPVDYLSDVLLQDHPAAEIDDLLPTAGDRDRPDPTSRAVRLRIVARANDAISSSKLEAARTSARLFSRFPFASTAFGNQPPFNPFVDTRIHRR